MLSHYKGVIWYTGDDTGPRGRTGAGGADRLALDEMLEMRAYMDEGGRVAYTGKRAGMQYTGVGAWATSSTTRRTRGGLPAAPPAPFDPRQCLLLRGSTRAATRSRTCSTGSAAWSDRR